MIFPGAARRGGVHTEFAEAVQQPLTQVPQMAQMENAKSDLV